jgi:hypothetical protein
VASGTRSCRDEYAPDLERAKLHQVTISSEVLESAAADPASPAWDIIWQESCHQGTCDPNSALLLPWLAQTCAAFSRGDREKAVVLAGFIAVDASDADRGTYTAEIAALRALAVDCLLGASTDSMFVYLQQAVLGFDGDEIWGKELDHINDGEVDVQCPECQGGTVGRLAVRRLPDRARALLRTGWPLVCRGRPGRPRVRGNRPDLPLRPVQLFRMRHPA